MIVIKNVFHEFQIVYDNPFHFLIFKSVIPLKKEITFSQLDLFFFIMVRSEPRRGRNQFQVPIELN